MKKTLMILLLLLIAPSVMAANLCGNNKADSGETCSSCPNDIKCPSGYSCITGNCVQVSKLPLLFTPKNLSIGMIGFGIIVAVIILIIQLLQKKKKKQEEELLNENQKIMKVELKDILPKKEEPLSQEKLQEINEEPPRPEDPRLLFVKDMINKGKTIEEVKAILKSKGWDDSQIFVIEMRFKGKSDEEIKHMLLSKGWEAGDVDNLLIGK